MDNIEQYIEQQLEKIDKKSSNEVKLNSLNAIYAVLESRGYRRNEIRRKIDKVIISKIKLLGDKLIKLTEDLTK